jgi:hypothetical protein
VFPLLNLASSHLIGFSSLPSNSTVEVLVQ